MVAIIALAVSSAAGETIWSPVPQDPQPPRSTSWKQGFQQRASRGAQLGVQPYAYGYFGAAPRHTFSAYHEGASGDWFQYSFRRGD